MAVAEVVVGALSVLIGADASPLAREARNAEGSMRNLEKVTSNVTNRLKNAFLTLAGPTAIGYMVKTSLDLVDTQSKLARQLGGTVEGVQTMARVADLAGVATEQLTMAMDRLNRKMGEAMRETAGPAADAFRRISVNVQELAKMDVSDRMALIADRIKALGLNAQQTADLIGQLGVRGGKIVALFENGGAAIRDATKEIRLFGVALSDVDGEKVEMANDAMTVFGLAARGVANQLAVELTPAMMAMASAFKEFVERQGGVAAIIEQVMERVVFEIDEVSKTWHQMKTAFYSAISSIVDGMNSFARFWNNTFSGFLPPLKTMENSFKTALTELETAPAGQAWKQWWDDQRKAADEAAKKAIEDRKALSTGTGEVDNLGQRERQQYENRLLALQASLASEDEVMRLHREKQLKELAEFEQRGILTKQAANDMRSQIDEEYHKKLDELVFQRLESGVATESEMLMRKHEEQLALIQQFEDDKTISQQKADELRLKYSEDAALRQAQITASAYSQMASIIDSSMSQISSVLGSESEKGFGIMKAISMATALVKGYEAAVSAYAFGAGFGGPPLGVAMAAVAAAGTAAMIAKLAGVNSSSKGSPSVSRGGGAASTSSGNNEGGGGGGSSAGVTQSLVVSGINRKELFSGDAVRDIAERLLEFQKDGGKVFFQ